MGVTDQHISIAGADASNLVPLIQMHRVSPRQPFPQLIADGVRRGDSLSMGVDKVYSSHDL